MRITISNILFAAGVALVTASVAAGLYALYFPDESRWRLTYHDSLASFADVGRLARCAWFVSGDIQSSSAAAIETLRNHDPSTKEAGCEWYESFLEVEDRSIEWTRLGAASLQLCGDIKPGLRGADSMPVAAHYTFREIGDTPVVAGRHCYTIDIASAPADDEWGHPLSTR